MELTETQKAFVSHLVLSGVTPTEAARCAGYSHPKVRSYELLRKPHIAAVIRQEQARMIDGDLANVALRTLRQVMESDKMSASARVAACRAVLEVGGYFKKGDGGNIALDDKDPLDMTTEELERFVAESRSRLTFLSEVKGHS